MEPQIKISIPKHKLYKKEIYEPLLLDCLNASSFFKSKGGGGFTKSKSEFNRECDALGQNGNYNIDFKCLISQDGAKNADETSLSKSEVLAGVTITGPSRAFIRGISELPFPNIWGFLIDDYIKLNCYNEIILLNENTPHMKSTIKSINKLLRINKNILFFLPTGLTIENLSDITLIYKRAKKAFNVLTKARKALACEHETYYALLVNNKFIIILSNNCEPLEQIELLSLHSWKKIKTI
ncbi:MAG: hypothetical protein FWC16_04770 [Defluviitaleaceae bacterium]|nr:hypothetical protein [Defluviitaleaceae bacterium]MCL2274220.1 hypothetical protein [Defluviitaleaceae bacterium]